MDDSPISELTLFGENGVIVKMYQYGGTDEIGIRIYNGRAWSDAKNIGGLINGNEVRKLRDWLN